MKLLLALLAGISPTGLPAGPAAAPPQTIPSVRAYLPEPGGAWLPTGNTRVVAESGGPLEDEARLLAGELDVPYTGGPSRTGDVTLAFNPAVAGPEAYELVVRDGRVTVRGATEAGVFYGTRTVRQSLRAHGRLPAGVFLDRPDRAQRGLMIDIARKHFTRDWIEARIRELGDLKLNQLHLHLSDDQAFRLESSSHPEIVAPEHLTKDDVRAILDLAARRHVTVIPEIDSPGHLGAVLEAHPELQLRGRDGAPVEGAVDISDPRSARLVDDLIREYAPLFPGQYWHLGGDEYRALTVPDPESAYPRLAAFARQRYGPGATVADATTGWLNDRAALVREQGKKVKAWNDGFFSSPRVEPHPDREVEYWTGKEIGATEPERYLRDGRTLVNLNDEYLYYVLGEPNEFRYPTGQRIHEEWSPAVLRGTGPVPAEMAGPDRIVGARLALWCDLAGAQTPAQIARGLRLPLHALAQKLWDPREPGLSWADFTELADRV